MVWGEKNPLYFHVPLHDGTNSGAIFPQIPYVFLFLTAWTSVTGLYIQRLHMWFLFLLLFSTSCSCKVTDVQDLCICEYLLQP